MRVNGIEVVCEMTMKYAQRTVNVLPTYGIMAMSTWDSVHSPGPVVQSPP